MKKSFYISRFGVLAQIILWVLIFIIMVVIHVWRGDYSKESIQITIILFLLLEGFISLTAPMTMMKIEFNKSFMSYKIGPFYLKKLYYKDIRFIKVFEISSGQYVLSKIFFSDRYLSYDDAKKGFDKVTIFKKDNLFILDYPQKGLDELLTKLFPDLFCENKTEEN